MFAAKSEQYDETKRATPRHQADNCIATIDGRAYPVFNWSDGGVLLQADDRMFSLSSPVDVTMKFRLNGKIIDVLQAGRVVRKSRDRLAVQFDQLSRDAFLKLRRVLDDSIAREFAESQAA